MAQVIRHTAFDASHPAVPAIYLIFTLGLTMFAMQPVLVALSLSGVLAYSLCIDGSWRTLAGLRWQLPIIALVAVLNPLFSASGSTELFRLGVRAVYLESLCYGATMGALLVASILWFRAAEAMLGFEKVMALAGNAAPVVALMVSTTMRLIPRFVRQGRQIAAVQDAVQVPGRGRVAAGGDRVRSRLRLSTALMGWGLEDSLETADAMRARGWGAWEGSGRRTTYARYRFAVSDALALAVLLAGGLACAFLAWVATAQFSFYPALSELVAWWGYVPLAAWMLLPSALHLYERSLFA